MFYDEHQEGRIMSNFEQASRFAVFISRDHCDNGIYSGRRRVSVMVYTLILIGLAALGSGCASISPRIDPVEADIDSPRDLIEPGKIKIDARNKSSRTAVMRIDSLMQYCYDYGLFNGNILVAEKGEVIYHRAFGIAKFNPVDSLQINYQFRLGSVTKQFTAMAIMMLKEQGKLGYDDDIQEYLPELSYQDVTIRHLLTHTSGLPDYMSLFSQYWDIDEKELLEKEMADNDDMLTMLASHPSEIAFKPGEKWQYSNTAYVLLALIVDRASGQPFEKFLQNHIFEPLDMTRTLVYSAIRDDRMENRVYGHRIALNAVDYISTDSHYLNGIAGDGAVYSTTGDLLKWDQALYTDILVSNTTLNEAFTPVVLNNDSTFNYGFGWRIDTTLTGKKRVGHSGSWVGFINAISREIDDNNTIIILTNHSSRYVSEIQNAVESILHNRAVKYPKISIATHIGKTLVTKGIDAAISQYHQLKRNEFAKYNFSVRELNSLGYKLIQLNKLAEAIAIFKLNVESFPESFNAYDSLGEAYMQNEKIDLAIKNFERSLELNPENSNALEKLQQLMNEK